MLLKTYQKKAAETAQYKHASYPFFALGEETGEVLGKIAKAVRKKHKLPDALIAEARRGHDPQLKEDLIKELGDVLWNVAMCADELGVRLENVAVLNLSKLKSRALRDQIEGEGDNR